MFLLYILLFGMESMGKEESRFGMMSVMHLTRVVCFLILFCMGWGVELSAQTAMPNPTTSGTERTVDASSSNEDELVLDIQTYRGHEYVELGNYMRLMGQLFPDGKAKSQWDPTNDILRIEANGKRIDTLGRTPRIVIDGRLEQVARPIAQNGREVLVPLDTIERTLDLLGIDFSLESTQPEVDPKQSGAGEESGEKSSNGRPIINLDDLDNAFGNFDDPNATGLDQGQDDFAGNDDASVLPGQGEMGEYLGGPEDVDGAAGVGDESAGVEGFDGIEQSGDSGEDDEMGEGVDLEPVGNVEQGKGFELSSDDEKTGGPSIDLSVMGSDTPDTVAGMSDNKGTDSALDLAIELMDQSTDDPAVQERVGEEGLGAGDGSPLMGGHGTLDQASIGNGMTGAGNTEIGNTDEQGMNMMDEEDVSGLTQMVTPHPTPAPPADPINTLPVRRSTNESEGAMQRSSLPGIDPPSSLQGKVLGLSWRQLADLQHRRPPQRVTIVHDTELSKLAGALSAWLERNLKLSVRLVTVPKDARRDSLKVLQEAQLTRPELLIDLMTDGSDLSGPGAYRVWTVHQALWPTDQGSVSRDEDGDHRYYLGHQFHSLALGSQLMREMGRFMPDRVVLFDLFPAYLLRRIDAPTVAVAIPTNEAQVSQSDEALRVHVARAIGEGISAYVQAMRRVSF